MSTNLVQEGDFKSLALQPHSITILEDAYQAVTKANRWGFLRRPDVPPNDKGFMFADLEELREIDRELKYTGHSGSSYAWTMRKMETIAKHGWDAFVQSVVRRPELPAAVMSLETAGFPSPCPCHKAQGKEGWCGVAGGGVPGCEH